MAPVHRRVPKFVLPVPEDDNKPKLQKVVGQLADAHYALEELESAEKEYQRALELSIRLQEKSMETRILSRLAALSADEGDLEKSNQYLPT